MLRGIPPVQAARGDVRDIALSLLDPIYNFFGFGRAAAPMELSASKGGSTAVAYNEPPGRDVRGLLDLHNTSAGFRRVVALVSERVGANPHSLVKLKRELPATHIMRQLWDRPNPYMTGEDWRALDCLYLDSVGEAFVAIIANEAGKIELYPLPPHWVTPVWGELGERVFFRVRLGSEGVEQIWSDSEIVWIKRLDPLNPYGRGSGLARAALDEIETAEYAARHTKAYFYNNATPSAVVGLPGANESQVKSVSDSWKAKTQGLRKAWGAFFVGHKIEVTQMSAPLKDQNVSEVMKMANDEIRMTFGVSPELLGQLASSNRATILEAETIFATNCLEPRLRKLCAAYREHLLPRLPAPYSAGVSLSYVSPIPDNTERRDKIMGERSWAFTINEHRQAAGHPAREDGDVYVMPKALVRVEAAEVQMEGGSQKALPDNVIVLELIKESA